MHSAIKKLSAFSLGLVAVAMNCAWASPTVILLRDSAQKGDDTVAKAIAQAYGDLYEQKTGIKPEQIMIDAELGVQELQQRVHNAARSSTQQLALIAVGEKTIETLAQANLPKEVKTLHASHMKTKLHPRLIGKVDRIALPFHTVGNFTDEIKGSRTQLVQTIGVAHGRSAQSAKLAFTENKANIPQKNAYLAVILGGDAPNEQNVQQLFTVDNARTLARYVAHQANGRYILVTNGPRTGKHDAQKQEIKTAHREGTVDLVTQAFMDELRATNIPPRDVMLFDFQFGKTTNEMDQILGALLSTAHAEILVPAESTSSVSEVIDVLKGAEQGSGNPAHKVTVYMNGAMNAAHEAHVSGEFFLGRVDQLLSQDLQPINVKTLEEDLEKKNPELLATLRLMGENATRTSAAEACARALLP
ncbi:MAG: hypothetical protein ACK5O7_02885 [Holosporales bacterium]